MNFLAWVKLGGGLAGVLAMIAVFALYKDHGRLQRLDREHRACVAAVKGERGLSLKACDSIILAAAEARDRAQACDAALAAEPENLFGVKASCPASIKRLIADRDAARFERDDARRLQSQVEAGQAAAIARAVSRAQSETLRTAHAQAVIAAQPRGGDGLVECGADCLRQLAQAAADPR